MKRLGTCAVLLSMIAAVVVSAGYLRGVRMQRVVPATVPPDERIFRAQAKDNQIIMHFSSVPLF